MTDAQLAAYWISVYSGSLDSTAVPAYGIVANQEPETVLIDPLLVPNYVPPVDWAADPRTLPVPANDIPHALRLVAGGGHGAGPVLRRTRPA